MRISFPWMVGVWILSLAVGAGLHFFFSAGARTDIQRGIASISGASDSNIPIRNLPPGFCNLAENYLCEWRSFGPMESNDSSVVRECVTTDDGNRICLPVLKISFQSSNSSLTSTLVAPSSQEIKCTLRGFGFRSEIESEAVDLKTAVQNLSSQCRSMTASAH